MWVDDRRNYLMIGVSVSLFSHVKHPWYWGFAVLGMVMAMFWVFKKFKVLGEADIKSLSWIFLGMGILGLPYFVAYAGLFGIIMGIYFLLKLVLFRKQAKLNPKTQFYPVILISFVLTCILMGLF